MGTHIPRVHRICQLAVLCLLFLLVLVLAVLLLLALVEVAARLRRRTAPHQAEPSRLFQRCLAVRPPVSPPRALTLGPGEGALTPESNGAPRR
eukprot:11755812-Alexandrium_andersonii.AAC.1